MQKIVIMETLIKFKMIEIWVNIIETLICIHIIQKIKKIIPEEKENKEQNEEEIEEGKEERKAEGLLGKIKNYDYKGLLGSNEEKKESMFEPYEILEHKYYEKMQQLVVKLKEEQSQLQYQLGSTQDAYEFELDINLEATQYKMPITRESLFSLKDIITKAKRQFTSTDKKTWKENVTKFINKHFMNDLVDDIVTKSHYNSSNVMLIIKDQIPQLRYLNETNIKENFFSTIVEQEGNQYDDKTKTNFTEYYHHFFLENLNGKINNKPVNTPEGLKELQNLLKEFQKLRDPEFYVEEKEEEEEKGEKEILEKIDMTYEPNLNLMRDFVKGNMKTKFVELKAERVIELIKEVSDKLEEQKDKVENKAKEIDKKLEALQRENVEKNKKIKEMEEENKRLKEEKEKEQNKLEAEKSNTLSQLEEEIRKQNIIKEQIKQLLVEKEENKNIKLKTQQQEEEIGKLQIKLKNLQDNYNEQIEKIKTDNTANKEKELIELKNRYDTEINEMKKNAEQLIAERDNKDALLNELNREREEEITVYKKQIESLKGLTENQRQILEANVKKLEGDYKANLAQLKENYKNELENTKAINDETRNQAADDIKKEYELKLEKIQEEYKSKLKGFEEEINQLNSVNNNLQKKNDDLSAKHGELENEIKQITDEKTKLEAELKAKKKELILTQNQLNALQVKKAELETDLKGKSEILEKQKTELEAKINESEQQKEIANQEQTISNLKKQLELKNEEIKQNMETIKRSQEIVQPLQKHITELENSIENLTSEKENLQSNLDDINYTLDKIIIDKVYKTFELLFNIKSKQEIKYNTEEQIFNKIKENPNIKSETKLYEFLDIFEDPIMMQYFENFIYIIYKRYLTNPENTELNTIIDDNFKNINKSEDFMYFETIRTKLIDYLLKQLNNNKNELLTNENYKQNLLNDNKFKRLNNIVNKIYDKFKIIYKNDVIEKNIVKNYIIEQFNLDKSFIVILKEGFKEGFKEPSFFEDEKNWNENTIKRLYEQILPTKHNLFEYNLKPSLLDKITLILRLINNIKKKITNFNDIATHNLSSTNTFFKDQSKTFTLIKNHIIDKNSVKYEHNNITKQLEQFRQNFKKHLNKFKDKIDIIYAENDKTEMIQDIENIEKKINVENFVIDINSYIKYIQTYKPNNLKGGKTKKQKNKRRKTYKKNKVSI